MNFQYLEHLEVEFLNSNVKLKDSVFSIRENSVEDLAVMKKKWLKKTKVQKVYTKGIA